MMSFESSNHPRGQADNAGQFRDKSNSGPEAALLSDATDRTPERIASDVVRNAYDEHGYNASYILETALNLRDNESGREVLGLIETAAREARPEQTAPAFKPEGEPDYYRSQWHTLESHQATDLSDGEGGLYPWGKLSITAGTVQGHTKWLDITSSQARRILEILSSEAE